MAPLSDAQYSSPYNTTANLYDFDTKENQYDEYSAKSRRVSEHTAVSSIPSSLPADDLPHLIHRKHRAPFRSPSSVRALQLSSPEPGSSPRHINHDLKKHKWSLGAVHNLSVTEDSDNESYTADGDSEILQHMMERKRQEKERHVRASGYRATSNTTVDTMQQPPLVLLHITVLPSTMKYSPTAMERLAPRHVLNNMHVLREKLNDVIFARGILVPHPHDEYDMLEERLLEALELCAPRVSPCGHFLGDEHDSFLDEDLSQDYKSDISVDVAVQQHAICNYAHADTVGGRASSRIDDEDVCETCAEPLRNPHRGTGHGNKRWEINFYAANGLMRAGAWGAAWREMERVDVEISPWIPDDIKRVLEEATRAEEESSAKVRREQDMRIDAIHTELQSATRRILDLEDDLIRSHEEVKRLKAATATPEPAIFQEINKEYPTSEPLRESIVLDLPQIPTDNRLNDEIPLSRLMLRYLCILAQDKKNVAIAIGSFIVLLMSIFIAPNLLANKGSQLATIDNGSSFTTGAAILSVTTAHSITTNVPTPTKYGMSIGNGSIETAAPAHRP